MRFIIHMQWGMLLLVAACFAAGGGLAISWQLLPLALSAALLGLPHGAVDHRVPGWALGRPLRAREMAALIAGYLLLVGAVLLGWMLAPGAAFLFFILLTGWHWGLGDLHFVLANGGAALLPGRWARGLTALLRGALPVLLPFVFFPADYRLVAATILGLFSAAPPEIDWLFGPGNRRLLLAALLGLMALALGTAGRGARRAGAGMALGRYAVETLLLFAFFALVPPILAVGIYFTGWHSLRHILRISQLQGGRSRLRGMIRFSGQALPLTLVSLLMLAGLALVFARAQADPLSLAGLYLALIAALTLPHALLVMWLDGREGVWRRGMVYK